MPIVVRNHVGGHHAQLATQQAAGQKIAATSLESQCRLCRRAERTAPCGRD